MVDGWKKVKIKRISYPLKGNALSKDKLTYEGRYKCILYGELFTKYKEVIRKVESRTDFHEGTLSRDGDILIPGSTTTVGIDLARASALNEENILLGGDINILRKVDDSYISNFLAYYITHNCKTDIAKIAQGSTIIHLYGKNLIELEICLPPVEEQKPIVGVLLKIDEAIEQTEDLIEKNKLIKAGLMQDLFTKGIDEKGNIRSEKTHEFKSSPLGRIPEEWDAVQITDIVTFIGSGVTPTGGSNVYKNEGVPFIRSQNVYDNGLRLDDIAFLTTEIDERMKRSRVENNDILLNITGASIGRCCSVPEGFPKANVNQHVCIIRLKNHTSDEAYYFSKFLSSFKGQNQIIMLNAGSNRQGLNYQQVRSIYVPYPKKEEERIKGAKLLRKIFFTISEEERKLIKLQHIKAGLMQDLLTGEVRVTPLMREAVAQHG